MKLLCSTQPVDCDKAFHSEIEKELCWLNEWGAEALDVWERPQAGKAPAINHCYTTDWVKAGKATLKFLGAEVQWNSDLKQYEIREPDPADPNQSDEEQPIAGP